MPAALPLKRPETAPAPASRRWPRFAFLFAAIVAIVSLLPYLLAYLWTPPGHHFAGFFFIADDATTYLAKMRQGADGSWLWNDPYTSEPPGGVFLFGFYSRYRPRARRRPPLPPAAAAPTPKPRAGPRHPRLRRRVPGASRRQPRDFGQPRGGARSAPSRAERLVLHSCYPPFR